uniref:Putative plant transposon protein domain-containing protein n=1 Tax=Solanum tuberosum TaxID=4113 RepID=M1DNQ9_SOLTU
MHPRKRTQGIVINEGAANPPKRTTTEVPENNSGSEREAFNSQAMLSEPEDNQPLESERVEICARFRPDSARVQQPILRQTQYQLRYLLWLQVRVSIEKKDLSVAAQCQFGFISISIMPPQNKSITCHLKAACLRSIISRKSIDMGLIIEQDMAMRAKQHQTSLHFPVLIIELCWRAGVPRDLTRDIEVTPSSFTDIWRIEAEYPREESDKKRVGPVDTSLEVGIDSIPAEASLPTLASGTSGTSAPTSSSQPPSASTSSQAMIVKMGHQAHSADVRATRLEVAVPWMIESSIPAALTSL